MNVYIGYKHRWCTNYGYLIICSFKTNALWNSSSQLLSPKNVFMSKLIFLFEITFQI